MPFPDARGHLPRAWKQLENAGGRLYMVVECGLAWGAGPGIEAKEADGVSLARSLFDGVRALAAGG